MPTFSSSKTMLKAAVSRAFKTPSFPASTNSARHLAHVSLFSEENIATECSGGGVRSLKIYDTHACMCSGDRMLPGKYFLILQTTN